MVKFAMTFALATVLALPAAAQSYQKQAMQLIEYTSPMLPPATYKGQWWPSPENCQYSRAGRPGETVWYLIVNSAHAKCPKRLIQRAYSDYN